MLFLNHASFNGLMRFNRSGDFNTPYGRNDERFTAKLVTDLAARTAAVGELMRQAGWLMSCADWRVTLGAATPGDFVYADPPYAGRNDGYYSGWSVDDAIELAEALKGLPCPWALSDWHSDRHGVNPLLRQLYGGRRIETCEHRYVVGASSSSRGPVREALVLSH